MITTLRIEADMALRRWREVLRWRLLKAIPRSWLYYIVIHATVRTLGGREHPDAIGAMEVARRLQPKLGER